MKEFLATCCLLVLICSGLSARDVRVKIIDTDLDLPLDGATVVTADGRSFKADSQGIVTFEVSDGATMTAQASYPGYQPLKFIISASLTYLEAKMVLQGTMGSTELVIEARKPGQSDQKVGVSTSVDRDQLRTTANLGIIEDVMTTIKALPGVGYTGGFDALPSIRGGEPQELTAVLDGFIVENPFHWGGAYSIFNPNMVESAKLSDGIFSVAYGYATSALLEVTSRVPDSTSMEANLGVTTSSTDVLVSVPFDGKGGLLIGGKVTYWDPLVAVVGLFAPSITQMLYKTPYIRDAYLKGNWYLSPTLILYLNGFFGSDGIGINSTGLNTGMVINTAIHFDWNNYLAFGTLGLKWTPDSQTYLHYMIGAGWAGSDSSYQGNQSGTQTYSAAFVSQYGSTYPGIVVPGGQFTVNKQTYSMDSVNNYNIQTRLDLNLYPAPWLVWSIGANEMIQFWYEKNSGSITLPNSSGNLVPTAFSIINDHNKAYNSSAYTSATLKTLDERLSLDLGVRVDHLYIMGQNGFALQTNPVFNPRANLSYVAVKNQSGIESLTFSLGSGLFSRPPTEMANFDTNYNLQSYQVKPNQVWTSVIGADLELDGGYKIQIEGYYKQVFNRFYYNEVSSFDSSTSTSRLDIKPHFDGEAIIWGIDLMLQKYQSRYVDGWITASYNYARYRNPVLDTGSVNPNSLTPSSATTGWYWPYFQRFFNANLIVNFKPTTGFTITTRLAFATGRPMTTVSAATPYAQIQADGQVIEQWQRTETYSDTERTQISIPLDLRVAWNWYEANSKVSTEFYIAVENALTNIYEPQSRKAIDPYTGGELSRSGSADFNIGFPLISIGFKWSY